MRVILMTIGALILSSCAYNKKELPEPVIVPEAGVTITYTDHVKRIIDNNCIVCHSSSGGQSPLLTNYSQVNSNANRVKARAIDNTPTPMPPGNPLPQALKDTLQFWINQGALQ